MCDDTDGDDEGAGELSVEGDSDEHGDELNGLDTGGRLPPRNNESDESGRTKGRGFGLVFGRDSRFPVVSGLVSCKAINF